MVYLTKAACSLQQSSNHSQRHSQHNRLWLLPHCCDQILHNLIKINGISSHVSHSILVHEFVKCYHQTPLPAFFVCRVIILMKFSIKDGNINGWLLIIFYFVLLAQRNFHVLHLSSRARLYSQNWSYSQAVSKFYAEDKRSTFKSAVWFDECWITTSQLTKIFLLPIQRRMLWNF
jgi:hypothetical protein